MDTVDTNKPISFYRDTQLLYFHVAKNMKLEMLLDESIPFSSKNLQLEVCEEWNLGDLQELIANMLDREFIGLGFVRDRPKEAVKPFCDAMSIDSMDITDRGKQIKITIKTLTGKRYEFKVSEDDNVERLFNDFSKAASISREQIRLVWKGKQLDANDVFKTLGFGEQEAIQQLNNRV